MYSLEQPIKSFLALSEVQLEKGMMRMDHNNYYLVREKAVPDVLLKVLEARKLLESEKALSINDAVEKVGISRSSYYKYKDDIQPFYDNIRGKTITFLLQMADEPGVLSKVLRKVAQCPVNILTIHQSIPVNGNAMLTLSVEVLDTTESVAEMIGNVESVSGVHYMKILSREGSLP